MNQLLDVFGPEVRILKSSLLHIMKKNQQRNNNIMCKFVFIMSLPAPPYPTLPQGNPSQGTQQTLATKQQSNSIHIKHLLNRFCVTPPSAPQPPR